jgi:hypothetical protein
MSRFKRLPVDWSATSAMELYFGDHYVGTFHMRFVDRSAPNVRMMRERVRRRLSTRDEARFDRPQNEADQEFRHRVLVDLFVATEIVSDWDMTDADGKPIPFSPDALREFLMDPDYRWALAHLEVFSTEPANFAPSKDAVAGE